MSCAPPPHRRSSAGGNDGGRLRHYFWLNKGPWSILDANQSFLPAACAGITIPARKPEGANFYPEGAGKESLEAWINALAPKDKEQAQWFFTTIRNGAQGTFRTLACAEEHDELFGYKAAFGAYVNIGDEKQTRKLDFFSKRGAERYPSRVRHGGQPEPRQVRLGRMAQTPIMPLCTDRKTTLRAVFHQ